MSYIAIDSGSVSSWVQPPRDGSLKNNSRFATKTKEEQKKTSSKQTSEITIPSSSSLNSTEHHNIRTTHGMAEAKENSHLSSMRANVQAINAREKVGHHSCRIVRQCPNCQMLYTSSFHSCGPSASSALSIRK